VCRQMNSYLLTATAVILIAASLYPQQIKDTYSDTILDLEPPRACLMSVSVVACLRLSDMLPTRE
jgi:hypothetical protein